MKILITGGAGFIGSHIADAYLADNHDVVIIDNLSTGFIDNVPSGAEFYQLDISEDGLDEVFEREKIDLVCHHAAQIDVRISVDNPVFDLTVNIGGSVNLLECCRRHQVGRFNFASTGGAIYGEQKKFPAGESHPTNPVSPYGIAKLAVEKYMYWYHLEFGMNCTALRYANVYGKRQSALGEAGVIAIFCQKMCDRDKPVINGDGLQTRDFVNVADVVAANMAVSNLQGFNVFNIGTGVETDVNTIFRHLNKFNGGGFEELHVPRKPGEQRRSSIDANKARKVLNWKPKVDLVSGLAETARYFQEINR